MGVNRSVVPEIETSQEAITHIKKEDINHLPLMRYDGPVVIISEPSQLPPVMEDLQAQTLLGFDTESRPCFKRGQNYPLALLQLATDNVVYLFQMGGLADALEPIFSILSSPSIIKAGVAIHDDIKKLQELYDFEAEGFVEISTYTQRQGIVNTGLRSLTAILLGHRISKGAQVSNWARSELSRQQITYAATDAWISRKLYETVEQLGWIHPKELELDPQ